MIDLALFTPRQVNDRINVIAHNGGFGRHRRHQLKLLEFAINFFLCIFRQRRSVNFLFKLFDVGTLFAFTKLFLNRLDLFVQIIVTLTLLHLLFDAPANAFFDLQNVDFSFELRKQGFKTF